MYHKLMLHRFRQQLQKRTLSTVLQDADPLADVSQVQSSLVVATHVLPDLSCRTSNTEHVEDYLLRNSNNSIVVKDWLKLVPTDISRH